MATALTPQTDVTSEKVTWLMENPRQQHDWVYLLTSLAFFCLQSYKCEFLTDTSRGNSALGHDVSSVCSTRLFCQSRPGISAGPLPIPGIHQRPADRVLGPCLFLAYTNDLQTECWAPAYSWQETVSSPYRRFPRTTPSCTASPSVS